MPSSFSLVLSELSPAAVGCHHNKLDDAHGFRQARVDVPSAFSFCAGSAGVGQAAFSLKQSRCPHCGCVETLNRHGKLYGNDPSAVAAQRQRGQRVFCSDRGQRGGCGRTFPMVLADVLPRHTVTASLLWPWLLALLTARSVKAAVEKLRLPFALETLYRLRRELRHTLDQVRARLCHDQSPAASAHTDPLLQTVEHLRQVFAGGGCPLTEFQLRFQQPFLG